MAGLLDKETVQKEVDLRAEFAKCEALIKEFDTQADAEKAYGSLNERQYERFRQTVLQLRDSFWQIKSKTVGGHYD